MSTRSRATRRPRLLAAALAIAIASVAALALPGCGGGYGGYGGYAPYGTLEVVNDPFSFWGIDAVEVTPPFGPTEGWDVFLAPGEGWDADFVPDDYEVVLFWADGSEDVYYVPVYDGDWTTIVGEN